MTNEKMIDAIINLVSNSSGDETEEQKKLKHDCYIKLLRLTHEEKYQYNNIKTTLLHRTLQDIPILYVANAKTNVLYLIEKLKNKNSNNDAVWREIGLLYYFLGDCNNAIYYLKKAAYLEIQQNFKKSACRAISLIDQLGMAAINELPNQLTDNAPEGFGLADIKKNFKTHHPHLNEQKANSLAIKLYAGTFKARITTDNIDLNNPFILFTQVNQYLKTKNQEKLLSLIEANSSTRAMVLECLEIIANSSDNDAAVFAQNILNSNVYNEYPYHIKKSTENSGTRGFWSFNYGTNQDVLNPNDIYIYADVKDWNKVVHLAREFPVKNNFFGLKIVPQNYKSALYVALGARCEEAIEALIDAGTPLSGLPDYGKTQSALHVLIGKGAGCGPDVAKFRLNPPPKLYRKASKAEIALKLVEKGADLSSKNSDGLTPVAYAAALAYSKGLPECIIALVKKYPAKNSFFKNDLYDYGMALSILANQMTFGNNSNTKALDAIDALLDSYDKFPFSLDYNKSVKYPKLIEKINKENNTPLHFLSACSLVQSKVQLKKLIEKGADLKAKNKDNYTPMELAVKVAIKNKQWHAVLTIAENYTIKNLFFHSWDRYKFGYALFFAVKYNQSEIIKKLIKANAPLVNYDAGDDTGNTLLHYAVLNQDLDIIKLLIKSGADLSAKNKAGQTPIELAALHENWDVVKTIAESTKTKKTIFREDIYGYGKALVLAEKAGKDNIADTLIAAGALLTEKDELGNTPLHYAVLHGHYNISVNLIRKKVDINTQNNVGETPAHIAVIQDNSETLNFLIKQGADLSIKNKAGNTPIQLMGAIYKTTHQEIIQSLLRDFDSPSEKKIFTDEHLKELLEFVLNIGMDNTPINKDFQNLCFCLGEFLIGRGGADNALLFLLLAEDKERTKGLIRECYLKILDISQANLKKYNCRALPTPLLLLKRDESTDFNSLTMKENIKTLIDDFKPFADKYLHISKEIGKMCYFVGDYKQAVPYLSKTCLDEFTHALSSQNNNRDSGESLELLLNIVAEGQYNNGSAQYQYSAEHQEPLSVYNAVKNYLSTHQIKELVSAIKNPAQAPVAIEFLKAIAISTHSEKENIEQAAKALSEYYFHQKQYQKAIIWGIDFASCDTLSNNQLTLLSSEEVVRELSIEKIIKILTLNKSFLTQECLETIIAHFQKTHSSSEEYKTFVLAILNSRSLYAKLSANRLIGLMADEEIKNSLSDDQKSILLWHLVKNTSIDIANIENYFGLLGKESFQTFRSRLKTSYLKSKLRHPEKAPEKIIYAEILLNAAHPSITAIKKLFDRYPENNLQNLYLLFSLIDKSQLIEEKYKDSWKKIIRDYAHESLTHKTASIENPIEKQQLLSRASHEFIFSENRHRFFKAIGKETNTVAKIKAQQIKAVNDFLHSTDDAALIIRIQDDKRTTIIQSIINQYDKTKSSKASPGSLALLSDLASPTFESNQKIEKIKQYILNHQSPFQQEKKLVKIIQQVFIEFLSAADENKDFTPITPVSHLGGLNSLR